MNVGEQNNKEPGNDGRTWIQVAETLGVSETQMILEYLRAQGIPAMAIESRGIALITGRHSIARVMVPLEEVGPALELLDPEDDFESEEDGPFDLTSPTSDLNKALLGTTAVAMIPLGAGIAYALSVTIGSEDDEGGDALFDCPKCGVSLELSEDEIGQRAFICPDCREAIRLDIYVACPWCEAELELEPNELSQGWFICPECRRAVRA
jgi:uncharacterized protein YbaR (Trm112 family)